MTLLRILLLPVLLISYGAPGAAAQAPKETYAILIGGLGGDATYSEKFSNYLSETKLQLGRQGVPEPNIIVLGESQIVEQPFVHDESTAEVIRATFQSLAQRVTPDDQVFVILFGHGSYDGTNASLNIPRRDLTDAEYSELLDDLSAGRIVFVNTASSSGPFATAIGGANRIVITATATGTERDVTVFPQYFVEALRSPGADLDKDGALSVRELFVYAAERTAASFEETGHLATEHAVIDDDGDGSATRAEDLPSATDGHLASVTYLRPPDAVSAADLPLVRERQELERTIAELKQRKATMEVDEYYARLETLFVRFARLNARLESEMGNR